MKKILSIVILIDIAAAPQKHIPIRKVKKEGENPSAIEEINRVKEASLKSLRDQEKGLTTESMFGRKLALADMVYSDILRVALFVEDGESLKKGESTMVSLQEQMTSKLNEIDRLFPDEAAKGAESARKYLARVARAGKAELDTLMLSEFGKEKTPEIYKQITHLAKGVLFSPIIAGFLGSDYFLLPEEIREILQSFDNVLTENIPQVRDIESIKGRFKIVISLIEDEKNLSIRTKKRLLESAFIEARINLLKIASADEVGENALAIYGIEMITLFDEALEALNEATDSLSGELDDEKEESLSALYKDVIRTYSKGLDQVKALLLSRSGSPASDAVKKLISTLDEKMEA